MHNQISLLVDEVSRLRLFVVSGNVEGLLESRERLLERLDGGAWDSAPSLSRTPSPSPTPPPSPGLFPIKQRKSLLTASLAEGSVVRDSRPVLERAPSSSSLETSGDERAWRSLARSSCRPGAFEILRDADGFEDEGEEEEEARDAVAASLVVLPELDTLARAAMRIYTGRCRSAWTTAQAKIPTAVRSSVLMAEHTEWEATQTALADHSLTGAGRAQSVAHNPGGAAELARNAGLAVSVCLELLEQVDAWMGGSSNRAAAFAYNCLVEVVASRGEAEGEGEGEGEGAGERGVDVPVADTYNDDEGAARAARRVPLLALVSGEVLTELALALAAAARACPRVWLRRLRTVHDAAAARGTDATSVHLETLGVFTSSQLRWTWEHNLRLVRRLTACHAGTAA